MLEIVKLALKYRTDLFDTELETYIDSCKKDLCFGGMNEEKWKDDDNAIVSVVVAYCKWFMNYQGQGERWEKIYKSLKTSIVLNKGYH